MNFKNLAEQTRTLFAGMVLLDTDKPVFNYYIETEDYPGLGSWVDPSKFPKQFYAVELRTDYEANAKEYEAAGVYYSNMLGCYMWPLLKSCGAWQMTSPQNIWE